MDNFDFTFNTTILVYKSTGKGTTNEYGMFKPEPDKLVASIPAFVYPISQSKVQQEYGISTEISYEIIASPSPILLKGTKIKFNGNMYEIEAIQDWNLSILPCLQFIVKRID